MKCEELLKWLNEFVDGTADPGICREFEQHLAGCDPCRVVIDNVRKTVTLYRNQEPYDLPPAFHARLHALIRQKWSESSPPRP